METYFRVDVLDDHDGGSVWIVEEDYIETFEEASDIAYRRSLSRDNGVAKVISVTAKEVGYFRNGSVVQSR